MNAKDVANLLNKMKIEYPENFSKELQQSWKDAGIVVITGGSDDLIYAYGAISDEGYGPGIVYVDRMYPTFITSTCDEGDECPYFKEIVSLYDTIEACWNDEGNPCWTYKTTIPHHTFNVYEDGELYAIGIVFSINDMW